jgi:diacylglycerol kinase (ATP)
MPYRIVVAINPSASFGKGRGVGPAVVELLESLGHEVVPLTAPDYAQLVEAGREAVASTPDAFVVVGGDGMVNLGTNLVAATGVPLGIVPSGTGNDMARGLGIAIDDPASAVTTLLEALAREPRDIDAGLIRHRDDVTGATKETWYACMVSAGFDAIVNERANRMTFPKGPSRYILALFFELIKLKPIPYRIVLDGVETIAPAALISVGNNVSLGGGMKVTPDAIVDDGLLDVLVVEPLGRLAFLRIFPRVFKGEHVTDPRVTIHRAKRVVIDAHTVVAFGDGERLGTLPVDIEVKPGALRILAPAV